MLEAKNLHKEYFQGTRKLHVLRGVDLMVAKAELVSIMGASGAGKSTLLHLLGALDQPSSGAVYVEGVSLFKKSESELARFRNEKIGFVFQFHHLLPEFTLFENVLMPGLIRGIAKAEIEEKGFAILKSVGLENRLHHRPGELSGGEQQRGALARAMVLAPAVLLADEFTGNLDTRSAHLVTELLLRLNGEKEVAIVAVTHNPQIASQFKSHYELKDGLLHISDKK